MKKDVLIYFLEISIMFISIIKISTNFAKKTYEQCLFFNNIHLLYNVKQKSVISQIVAVYVCKYKFLLSIIVLFFGKKSVIKNIVRTRDIRYLYSNGKGNLRNIHELNLIIYRFSQDNDERLICTQCNCGLFHRWCLLWRLFDTWL